MSQVLSCKEKEKPLKKTNSTDFTGLCLREPVKPVESLFPRKGIAELPAKDVPQILLLQSKSNRQGKHTTYGLTTLFTRIPLRHHLHNAKCFLI